MLTTETETTEGVRMKRIVLLGDSIIDNGAYVRSGEPDVARQLQERLPGATVVKRALDGAKVDDVLGQLNDLTSEDIIVLSVGGNNALEHVGLLEQSSKVKYLGALNKLWDIRKGFEAQYRRLMERIAEKQPDPTKVTVMTVYDPCFVGSSYPEEYQKAAEAAVSMFNDVIQREAASMGYTVIELRELFTDKGDYANPIEPSAQGGDKIAEALADWTGGMS
jgi:lysophospholipase L1-like esterase